MMSRFRLIVAAAAVSLFVVALPAAPAVASESADCTFGFVHLVGNWKVCLNSVRVAERPSSCVNRLEGMAPPPVPLAS